MGMEEIVQGNFSRSSAPSELRITDIRFTDIVGAPMQDRFRLSVHRFDPPLLHHSRSAGQMQFPALLTAIIRFYFPPVMRISMSPVLVVISHLPPAVLCGTFTSPVAVCAVKVFPERSVPEMSPVLVWMTISSASLL